MLIDADGDGGAWLGRGTRILPRRADERGLVRCGEGLLFARREPECLTQEQAGCVSRVAQFV
jgi:hypothetical protein